VCRSQTPSVTCSNEAKRNEIQVQGLVELRLEEMYRLGLEIQQKTKTLGDL